MSSVSSVYWMEPLDSFVLPIEFRFHPGSSALCPIPPSVHCQLLIQNELHFSRHFVVVFEMGFECQDGAADAPPGAMAQWEHLFAEPQVKKLITKYRPGADGAPFDLTNFESNQLRDATVMEKFETRTSLKKWPPPGRPFCLPDWMDLSGGFDPSKSGCAEQTVT